MAINHIQVTNNTKALSTDFNAVSDDACNTTNDIHPQYLKPLVDGLTYSLFAENTAGAGGYSVKETISKPLASPNLKDYIINTANVYENDSYLSNVIFVKGQEDKLHISCSGANPITAGSTSSGYVKYEIWTIEGDGTRTLFSAGSELQPPFYFGVIELDEGTPIDISTIPSGMIVYVGVKYYVNVPNDGDTIYYNIESLRVTPVLTTT